MVILVRDDLRDNGSDHVRDDVRDCVIAVMLILNTLTTCDDNLRSDPSLVKYVLHYIIMRK